MPTDKRIEAAESAVVEHAAITGTTELRMFHRIAELLKDLRVLADSLGLPWPALLKEMERRYEMERTQGDA